METIRSPREIEHMFDCAKRVAHPLLAVLVTERSCDRGPEGRVVFIAGRKIGNAVLRNRCKRVLREMARRAGGAWSGYDVALIARPATATAGPEELDSALGAALRRLGVAQ